MISHSEHELRAALRGSQIVPYFQPLVDLRTGGLSGFEVLARWKHPERGFVPPLDFVPLAEATGLVGTLTERLLREAFTTAVEIPYQLGLSVNISPIQLLDRSLPEQIHRLADETGFPLKCLTVELTETALLDNLEQAQAVTEALKGLGIKLALDDFGTGYSSLTHLQALSFDELKVDQSFIKAMSCRRESRKIVAAVVGLGRSLGLRTVAEGVEEESQAEMLLCLGCEFGQGWLYGKPVPAAMLREVVEAHAHLPIPTTDAPERAEATLCIEALPMQRYAQLQAIYDGAPVGLCFLDCGLRYVSLNRRLAEMNGAPIKQHLGRTVQELAPLVYKEVEPYLRRALNGEPITGVEIERPSPDAPGGRITVLISYRPARDEAGEVVGISVAMVDISERKRWEGELRESEDHYRHMVELNPQVPWTMDPQGKNIDISPRWQNLTGLSPAEARGFGWLKAVHSDDLERLTDAWLEAFRSGEPLDFEYRVSRGDGVWHWIRSRGAPRRSPDGEIVGWYGSAEMIDEQKEAAEDLKRSEARLQAIIDAVPMGIVIAEAPNGRIVGRNPAAERILQQNPGDFESIEDYPKSVAYYRNGRRLEAADFPLARALAQGEVTEAQEVFYDLGNGLGKWLSLTGAPVRDKEGEIIGAIVVIQEAEASKRDNYDRRCPYATSPKGARAEEWASS